MKERNYFLSVCRRQILRGFFYFAGTFNESFVQVSPFKKEAIFGGSQHNVARMKRVHSGKLPMFQTLANQYKAGSIVVQTLAAGTTLVQKNKQMPRKWILFQYIFGSLKQAIKTSPHVCGLSTQINFRPAIEGDHADFFRKSKR